MKIIFFIAILALLISCSDDQSTNTPEVFDYFSLNNVWTYKTFDFDSQGNIKTEGQTFDTVKYAGLKVILDKNAKVLSTHKSNGDNAENYFYVDAKKLYAHSKYITPDLSDTDFDFPFNLPDEWVLIADDDGSKWDLATQQISDFALATPLGEANVNGTLSISAQKGSSKEITFNDKKYKAKEFKLLYEFKGKLKISIFNPDLNFTITEHYWYANGIGLYQMIRQPVTVTVPNVMTQTFDGKESILINHQSLVQ